MKINFDKDDMINCNIELSRTLISESLIYPQDEIKAKKLFLAYKNLEKILKMMGVDLQDKN